MLIDKNGNYYTVYMHSDDGAAISEEIADDVKTRYPKP